MKKILIAIFISVTLAANATTYFLGPNGNDASGNGSINAPWKTLAFACSKAISSGDIIHVNAGTYPETSQSKLAAGVSIEGEGVNSLITSNIATEYMYTILLQSGSEGTNGNQHISNIKMNGSSSAFAAIGINARSNVKIYNCTFENFFAQGVMFNGGTGYLSRAPGTFATGNEFHDNIITNCARYVAANNNGDGCVMIGGQNGLLIYNNTITQTARGAGLNGYCFKYYSEGYNKGVKIYNNILTTAPAAGSEPSNSWGFILESHNSLGGMELYGNTCKGAWDLCGSSKGTYEFAWDIHDNTMGFDTQSPALDTEGDVGIRFESNFERSNIYRNHFKNLSMAIYVSCSTGFTMKDLYIYSNLFENLGTNINGKGWALRFTPNPMSDLSNTVTNWNIWNNVIIAGTSHSTAYGIQLPYGNASNFSVRNNIIEGFDQGPVQNGTSGSGSNVSIENNIFYNNGNSNAAAGSIAYTNYVNQNNLKVDPLFVSSTDFHLQSSSPAIGKGIDVGLTTDYNGNSWKNPPSIGAFESGSASSAPVAPVYQSSLVANATPAVIQMVYNLSLTNVVPAVSAFNVQVNSVGRSINSVTIAGSIVQLTLAGAIVYGDIVTVSYTAPVSNPLQTAAGGQSATIGAQTVTNNVAAIIPVYVSSAVANATPSLLEMTYNLTLANIVPAVSSFSVLVNSAARTVSTVVISGTKVQLTLSSPIVYGDVITVSYIKPSFNFLQTSSAGIAASISNQPVTNNCINIAPTVVITSPVINSSFTSPATITITANASDTDGSISMVEFYSGSTKIGSFSSAPYSFTWNNVASGSYSLTVIATDNKNAKTTSSAIPITVNNGTYATNKHPMIKISNPRKGNNYDNLSSIEIDATASDPDGSISKVEIYNGAVKLVEMSSAPYTFTWKDVAAGTYKITAIATDNLNDTTISSPVEFIVGVKVKYDANSDMINLYPNPKDGHFSIEFVSPLKNEKSEIVITDLAGKQVYNGPVLKEEITKQFDLSGSKAGIYVMIVKDKDIIVTKKFIKNSQ